MYNNIDRIYQKTTKIKKGIKTMEILGMSASFAAGIVAGILVEKALSHSKADKVVDKEKLLEDCFGEHIYVGKFSLAQARDWINARKENINNGSKALVLKITSETLKNLGKDIEISSDMENYLAIAVINSTTKEIEDSILVKYDELDEKLEELLAKGDGTLVVGG